MKHTPPPPLPGKEPKPDKRCAVKIDKPDGEWKNPDTGEFEWVTTWPFRKPYMRLLLYLYKETWIKKMLDNYYSCTNMIVFDNLLFEIMTKLRRTKNHKYLSRDIKRCKGAFIGTLYNKHLMITRKFKSDLRKSKWSQYLMDSGRARYLQAMRKSGLKYHTS